MSTPSTLTAPEVGTMSPMIMPIVVVLPAPLPPSRPVTEPVSMANEIASTAVVAPKRLASGRASMAAGAGDKGSGARKGSGRWVLAAARRNVTAGGASARQPGAPD